MTVMLTSGGCKESDEERRYPSDLGYRRHGFYRVTDRGR